MKGEDEVVAMGASAGDYRPQIYAQLITNYIDYGLGLQDTLDRPRFVWDGDESVLVEGGGELEGKLAVRRLSNPSLNGLGVAQAVKVKGSVKWAACDFRGDGIPLGQL